MKKFLILIGLSLAVSACQKASNTVIDNSRPLTAQLNYFSGDSVDIASYINNSSAQLIVSDSFQVGIDYPPSFGYLQVSVTNDSGETVASDRFSSISAGTVTGAVVFSPPSVYVGNLTFSFTPYNQVGQAGNAVSALLKLYNSKNHPPVIDSVIMQDSVQIQDSTQVAFLIYAVASDPDGIGDLKSVYFYSYKPDGSLSNSGNPISMFDDGGAAGQALGDFDSVANDGIYTLAVRLPPLNAPTPPELGTYVFKFYAEDRSGAISKPVTHDIKVYK